jgi:hypothetical protein
VLELETTAPLDVVENVLVPVENDVPEETMVPEEIEPEETSDPVEPMVPLEKEPCEEEWPEVEAQICGSRQVQRSLSQIPHFMKLMQLMVHCCCVQSGPVEEELPVDIIPPCPPAPGFAPPAELSGLPCAHAKAETIQIGALTRAARRSHGCAGLPRELTGSCRLKPRC